MLPHHACEYSEVRGGERVRSLRSQSYCRFASILLLLDTFLSRSKPNHFRTQMHLPKLGLICFQMASFGYLSVQIWIKPSSNPCTPAHKHYMFVISLSNGLETS